MSVDICVINYNTKDKLQRLLECLNSDYEEGVWNLYVADNGSTDGSDVFLKENFSKYNIKEMHVNENIGYAAAANDLAAQGDGDIIGILNADVWLETKDVKSIQDSFADAEVSILGPKQRDEAGNITHAGIFGTNNAPKHRGWKQLDKYDRMYRDKLECVTVSGSAYFVRRAVWNTLTSNKDYNEMLAKFRTSGVITDRNDDEGWRGTMPGAFLPTRHYFEETWLSYFSRHMGYKVFYDGRVSIGHSWHASSKVGGEADQLFHESKKTFVAACEYFGIEHD